MTFFQLATSSMILTLLNFTPHLLHPKQLSSISFSRPQLFQSRTNTDPVLSKLCLNIQGLIDNRLQPLSRHPAVHFREVVSVIKKQKVDLSIPDRYSDEDISVLC